MTLNQLNQSDFETARMALLDCCGSTAWAAAMANRRPFQDVTNLHTTAKEVWHTLGESDWLEAFAAHPKIGEKKTSAKWFPSEQSGMNDASERTTNSIHRLNAEYEQRFGWIFIVCATGKSAEEMHHALKTRLGNDPSTELVIAAGEQSKIMQLRLEKLLIK